MRFAAPDLLWLVMALAPGMTLFLWWAWRRKQQLISQFVQSRLLAVLTVGVSTLRQKLRMTLLVAAVALVIVALARPQWGFSWEEARQRGLDIVVAIDTSRSMLASDIAPNRLTRAKLAALDLRQLAKTDRLGLVAFAGSAFLQCPLTLDDEAFRQSVNALDVRIIPQGGTALAEAIQAALTAFKDNDDNYKVLVLFTDGEDHDSGAVSAAKDAAQKGLRIFTVGVGTPNGELIQVTDDQGNKAFLKDDHGNVVKSRLDERLLQDVAEAGNGFYLPLSGAKAIEALYKDGLARLPKTEFASKMVRRYTERFQWPLGLAIVVLLVEMFLPERKRVRRTEALVSAGVSPELRKAVTLALVLALPGGLFASTAKALREYKAGNYEDSLKEYERLVRKKPDDARLHYNAGTAAYGAQKYEEALGELHASLSTTDWQLQQKSYYNLGNTYYRAGEQEPDAAKKKDHWERAIKSYESALKLNAQDEDAKFNLALVKKKLEELQQQQAKQQQKDKSEPDQDQKQKEQSQQSEKKPDDKTGSEKQNQQDQEQQKQQQEQQRQQQEKEAEKKQNESQQQQANSSSKDKPQDQSQPGEATNAVPLQMTQQQAEQLLDAQKSSEKPMIFIPADKPKRGNRVIKDW
jgi:Ca-activated chloride channel family protein